MLQSTGILVTPCNQADINITSFISISINI